MATASEITQSWEEQQGQMSQPLVIYVYFKQIKKNKNHTMAKNGQKFVNLISDKRSFRGLIIISATVVFHRNPNLSDECDLERLRFLPPDEDLERLRFRVLSGEEDGVRDLLWGEEPFPDLELDLLEEYTKHYGQYN